MSDKTDYGFDLESILAEFSSDTAGIKAPPEDPARGMQPEFAAEDAAGSEAPVSEEASPAAERAARRPADGFRADFERNNPPAPRTPAAPEKGRSAPKPVRHGEHVGDSGAPKDGGRRRAEFDPDFFRRREDTGKPRRVRHAPAPEVLSGPEPEEEYVPSDGVPPAARILLGMLAFLLSIVFFLWIAVNVHPGTEAAAAAPAAGAKTDLVGRLNVYLNNAASDALGDLAYIKKQYTIDYSATVAPKPDAGKFVTFGTDEAGRVDEIIEQARTFGLLDGQDLIFSSDTDFYWDSDIRCYCDETILVICWKELIDNRVCSCVEVKLADGSQIRRKLVNDTFGSNERVVASELSRSANAVVAMNADFYKYRDLGICVYQGQLCRYETSCDVLFIDANGDFRMLSAGELGSREDIEQFIADNNILFSMSFGPILVRDGELLQLEGSYAGGIGEMNQQYSRSGIGQYDKLHYLIMTVNHSQDGTPRATVNDFARLMYGKGVQNAYNFDGGQTSEVLINNERYNYVDWDSEREVSDILYFATAIPEQEVG